jgi:nucleotide-binding universal stress UspA family protein
MNAEITKILLTTDCSDLSGRALPAAVTLAADFEARLHVLSVIDDSLFAAAPPQGAGTLSTPALLQYFEETESETHKMIEDRLVNLPVDTRIAVHRAPIPTVAINQYAARNGIDLVVMATHGYSGWKHFLLGSTAEGVVRRSEVPVLTIHDPEKKDTEAFVLAAAPRKILMTTDTSEESYKALPWAQGFADLYSADLTVLSIVEEAYYPTLLGGASAMQVLTEAVPHVREKVTARLAADKVDAQLEVTQAMQPAQEILRIAEELKVDLIVMATQGRTGLDHLLMGSVTERVLRTSNVPVLTVR